MLGLRTARMAARPAFRQTIRQPIARRWASEGGLEGTADNAFNRERQAVKEHAAATSGVYYLLLEQRAHKPAHGNPARAFQSSSNPSYHRTCLGKQVLLTIITFLPDLWRKLSIYVVIHASVSPA